MKRTVYLIISLSVLLLAVIARAEEGTTTGQITGSWITPKNGAMAGGLVLLFNEASGPPPAHERYWRVSDIKADIDKEGGFSAEVEAGNYYLAAIKRTKENEPGPPLDGDFYYLSRDANGAPRLYTVKNGEKTDVGTITEASPFKRASLKTADGITALEGTITGPEGKPVAGALVLAYLSPEMEGRPLFISDKTGADGKYLLRVSEGGDYYLKIRNVYGGGTPETGAIMGHYGTGAPAAASVTTGAIRKGMDIKGTRFAGQGVRQ